MNRRTVRTLAGGLVALLLAGCGPPGDGTSSSSGTTSGDSTAASATPVRVARIRVDTLRLTVTAPGRTDVLQAERVRAPFAGTLTSLRVRAGDRVAAGQVVGTMLASTSEAALEGARGMLVSARTAADSADAERALELARQSRVERALRPSASGVVLSDSASQGDRLAEGEEIVQIATSGSVVFIVEAPQSDLSSIRPGQSVVVHVPARAESLAGVVHEILPSATSGAFSAPVRVDLRSSGTIDGVGLFGTATIIVGERAGVLSVPVDAVLTDDLTGTSRLAVVTPEGRASWVDVDPGIRSAGRVEVQGAGLAAGDRVIVSGQVGLPEGAPVQVAP